VGIVNEEGDGAERRSASRPPPIPDQLVGMRLGESYSAVPNPDPSSLTTAALLREVSRLEALLDVRIIGMERIQAEKFRRVEQQFSLVEQQRVEQKSDTKAAVDAALTAQKEAVKEQTTASERAIAKSETATAKSIEELRSTFTATLEPIRRDLDDMKGRIVASEVQRTTSAETITQGKDDTGRIIGFLFGAVGSVVGVIGILIVIGDVLTP
jgi:hypothetical protein